MNTDEMNTLSADKPITDPKHDRLGYAPFAKHLAESIHRMSPPEGLVIAIYGPWGSGKTTLLNFVVHYLKQKPEQQQPIVVSFNPWWFSGHEDLTRRFFAQLQAVLSKWESISKDVKNHIADFAELVSEIPLPGAAAGKPLARILRPSLKDVPDLKRKVAAALQKQGQKILVVIDDIDRLTSEEIRHLFRLVKAVADFPNVLYLLAFDKEVAVSALGEMQGISGEAYLEKIVQVPIELPTVDKTAIRRLLFDKLDTILACTPDGLLDQVYWANIYYEGIDHYISTPRDIVRLTNTLAVTYPAVAGEVNPVDFVAIETLRVFCPTLYRIIRDNTESFAGVVDLSGLSTSTPSSLKSFHNSWLDKMPEESRESVKHMLMRLFPMLESVWDNRGHSTGFLSVWRRELRICSPDIFPVYFRLTLPEGSISHAEMRAILSLTSNAEAFSAKLLELAAQKHPDGTSRVRALLERLEDYTGKDIPLESIPSVVSSLLDVGDRLLLPEDKPQGIFDVGNHIRIARVNLQLLKRLEEPARFQVLEEAISGGQATSTIVREVAILGQEHGKFGGRPAGPEEEMIVTPEHLEMLEKAVLEKIRDAAANDSLLSTPMLRSVLPCWIDWGSGEEDVRKWVRGITSTDEGIAQFLEGFLQETYGQAVSDVVGRTRYRLDPKWLERFLDPSEIIDRVRGLAGQSDLTERQGLAARQFVREYEMREKGKDPDTPRAWWGEE